MTLFQNNWNNFLSLDQYDLSDNLFDNDFELFSVATSSEFLFNNPDEQAPRSIHHDCKQIESSGGSLQSSDVSETSEYQFDILQQSKKCEIRNQDCMWSGTNNSYSKGGGGGGSGNSNSNSNNNDKCRNRNNSINFDIDFSIIKQENEKTDLVSPCDVIQLPKIYHQQQQKQTGGEKHHQKAQITGGGGAHTIQNIPPGTSLLINSRNQQKKQQQSQQQDLRVSIPNLLTTDFLKDRDSLSTISNGRPDTPLSLDDDALEFKHNVDLSACIMGSNNISLETDEVKKINTIKEDLEENRDVRQYFSSTGRHRSLSEVLNIIGNVETTVTSNGSNTSSSSSSSTSSSSSNQQTTSLPAGYSTNRNSNSSSSSISNNLHIDVEESDETDSDDDTTEGSSSIPFSSPSSTRQQIDFSVAHSDHSYTRSNVDIVGLETPSDSDEEIDVVSIGDKKLPTNPSDKDRRALQTKVAHKISASRMVKTANGLKTIPPRRRRSLIDIYSGNTTIASGTCTPSGGRTSITSRYSSPGSTPSYYSSSSSGGLNSKYSAPPTPLSTSTNGSRKRNQHQHSTSLKDEYFPPSKRNRSKKNANSSNSSSNNGSSNHHYSSQHHHHHHSSGVSSSLYSRNGNRKYDPNDTDPSTIEKRNLHNDMERQRRIGLKNLFESLKKQIPTLQDKERAPKVNILREAASLCAQMTREDSLLIAQKQQLQIQLQKREAYLKNLLKQQQQHLS